MNQSARILTNEIFQLINDTIQEHNLQQMVSYFCTLLNVSRSGYYNYINNYHNRKIQENKELQAKHLILKAMNHHGYKKGSRSIYMTLKNEFNITFNRKKIQRIMRKCQLICPIRKANPYRRMAKATKEHSIVSNLLNRKFKRKCQVKFL